MGVLWITLMLSASAVDNRLSVAAMNGDKTAVLSLLKQKVDVNAPQGDGSTALHWAADREDLEMAQALIQAGADPNAKTRLNDITPLYMAAKTGNAAMLQLLVKSGAALNATTTTGTTALMMSSASGSVDAVKVLLDSGAIVDAKDVYQGQTALMFAAALNRTAVIKLLVVRGANVNTVSLVPDPAKKDAPIRAQNAENQPARRGGRAASALALGGMTPLQFAAREGHMSAVQSLIEAGADVNLLTASDKMSTLTIAIMNGHFDVAQYLLDHGADPRPANTTGITPLFMLEDAQWAAKVWYPPPGVDQEKTSYLDLMKSLLAHGADPNARLGSKLWLRQFHGDWVDPAGATALWRAAQADDVAAMKVLVAGGANPNIPTTHGSSPLQVAMGFGLEPQISTFVPDSRMAAAKYLLEELHADVNSKDDKGYTPLHAAALTGENSLIEYLVAQGADPRARANQFFGRGDGAGEDVAPGTGDTVADMANGPRERNLVYPETVALLVKLGSVNSDYCRAATCVIKPRPDQRKPGGQ